MPLLLRHLAAAMLPLASTAAGIVAVGIAVQLPSRPPASVDVPLVQAPVSPGRPVLGTVARAPRAAPPPRRQDLPHVAAARPAVRLAPVLRELPARGEPAAPSVPVPAEKPAVSEEQAPVAAAPAPPQAIPAPVVAPVPVVTPVPVAPTVPLAPPVPEAPTVPVAAPAAQAPGIATLEVTPEPSKKHAGHGDPGKSDHAGRGHDDSGEGPKHGSDEAPETVGAAPAATPPPPEPDALPPPGSDSPGGAHPDRRPNDEGAHERGHDRGGGKHGP